MSVVVHSDKPLDVTRSLFNDDITESSKTLGELGKLFLEYDLPDK
jgi:hypothetical protein